MNSVIRATGGVSPCFLYRGQRAEADQQLPAVKRRNMRMPVHRQQPEEEGEDQLVPDISDSSAAVTDAADNQQTLYIRCVPHVDSRWRVLKLGGSTFVTGFSQSALSERGCWHAWGGVQRAGQ